MQNSYVVKRTQTSRSPIGISCIAIAEPSERKSSVSDACGKVIHEFTEKHSENSAVREHTHEVAMLIYAAKTKHLKRQIDKAKPQTLI